MEENMMAAAALALATEKGPGTMPLIGAAPVGSLSRAREPGSISSETISSVVSSRFTVTIFSYGLYPLFVRRILC